jgi:hypothetical protein
MSLILYEYFFLSLVATAEGSFKFPTAARVYQLQGPRIRPAAPSFPGGTDIMRTKHFRTA